MGLAIAHWSFLCRYTGGGRFYFRRNEDGRIVGIHYVPPAPLWLSSGRVMGGNQDRPGGAERLGTLSEEQFQTLPEIEYKPVASHYDEDQEEVVGGVPIETTNKKHVESYDEAASSIKSDDETSPVSGSSDGETEDSMRQSDVLTDENPDASEDYIPDGNRAQENEGENIDGSGNSSRKEEEGEARSTSDDDDMVVNMERGEQSGTNLTGHDSEVECRSSMCSVCLDDFSAGEKIILLPRCQHGFHRDCIHPWLTERQGCCPFCKTPVFPDPTDEEGNADTITENVDEEAHTENTPRAENDTTTNDMNSNGSMQIESNRPDVERGGRGEGVTEAISQSNDRIEVLPDDREVAPFDDSQSNEASS